MKDDISINGLWRDLLANPSTADHIITKFAQTQIGGDGWILVSGKTKNEIIAAFNNTMQYSSETNEQISRLIWSGAIPLGAGALQREPISHTTIPLIPHEYPLIGCHRFSDYIAQGTSLQTTVIPYASSSALNEGPQSRALVRVQDTSLIPHQAASNTSHARGHYVRDITPRVANIPNIRCMGPQKIYTTAKTHLVASKILFPESSRFDLLRNISTILQGVGLYLDIKAYWAPSHQHPFLHAVGNGLVVYTISEVQYFGLASIIGSGPAFAVTFLMTFGSLPPELFDFDYKAEVNSVTKRHEQYRELLPIELADELLANDMEMLAYTRIMMPFLKMIHPICQPLQYLSPMNVWEEMKSSDGLIGELKPALTTFLVDLQNDSSPLAKAGFAEMGISELDWNFAQAAKGVSRSVGNFRTFMRKHFKGKPYFSKNELHLFMGHGGTISKESLLTNSSSKPQAYRYFITVSGQITFLRKTVFKKNYSLDNDCYLNGRFDPILWDGNEILASGTIEVCHGQVTRIDYDFGPNESSPILLHYLEYFFKKEELGGVYLNTDTQTASSSLSEHSISPSPSAETPPVSVENQSEHLKPRNIISQVVDNPSTTVKAQEVVTEEAVAEYQQYVINRDTNSTWGNILKSAKIADVRLSVTPTGDPGLVATLESGAEVFVGASSATGAVLGISIKLNAATWGQVLSLLPYAMPVLIIIASVMVFMHFGNEHAKKKLKKNNEKTNVAIDRIKEWADGPLAEICKKFNDGKMPVLEFIQKLDLPISEINYDLKIISKALDYAERKNDPNSFWYQLSAYNAAKSHVVQLEHYQRLLKLQEHGKEYAKQFKGCNDKEILAELERILDQERVLSHEDYACYLNLLMTLLGKSPTRITLYQVKNQVKPNSQPIHLDHIGESVPKKPSNKEKAYKTTKDWERGKEIRHLLSDIGSKVGELNCIFKGLQKGDTLSIINAIIEHLKDIKTIAAKTKDNNGRYLSEEFEKYCNDLIEAVNKIKEEYESNPNQCSLSQAQIDELNRKIVAPCEYMAQHILLASLINNGISFAKKLASDCLDPDAQSTQMINRSLDFYQALHVTAPFLSTTLLQIPEAVGRGEMESLRIAFKEMGRSWGWSRIRPSSFSDAHETVSIVSSWWRFFGFDKEHPRVTRVLNKLEQMGPYGKLIESSVNLGKFDFKAATNADMAGVICQFAQALTTVGFSLTEAGVNFFGSEHPLPQNLNQIEAVVYPPVYRVINNITFPGHLPENVHYHRAMAITPVVIASCCDIGSVAVRWAAYSTAVSAATTGPGALAIAPLTTTVVTAFNVTYKMSQIAYDFQDGVFDLKAYENMVLNGEYYERQGDVLKARLKFVMAKSAFLGYGYGLTFSSGLTASANYARKSLFEYQLKELLKQEDSLPAFLELTRVNYKLGIMIKNSMPIEGMFHIVIKRLEILIEQDNFATNWREVKAEISACFQFYFKQPTISKELHNFYNAAFDNIQAQFANKLICHIGKYIDSHQFDKAQVLIKELQSKTVNFSDTVNHNSIQQKVDSGFYFDALNCLASGNGYDAISKFQQILRAPEQYDLIIESPEFWMYFIQSILLCFHRCKENHYKLLNQVIIFSLQKFLEYRGENSQISTLLATLREIVKDSDTEWTLQDVGQLHIHNCFVTFDELFLVQSGLGDVLSICRDNEDDCVTELRSFLELMATYYQPVRTLAYLFPIVHPTTGSNIKANILNINCSFNGVNAPLLLHAIREKKFKLAREIIQQGANPDVYDECNQGALQYLVNLKVNEHSSIDAQEFSVWLFNLLSRSSSKQILRAIQSAAASGNIFLFNQYTGSNPSTIELPHLLPALKSGNLEFLTAILDQYPNLANQKNSRGEGWMHLISAQGDRLACETLVSLMQIDLNARVNGEETSATALSIALRNKRYKLAEYLIEHGADISLRYGTKRNTLLHLSVKAGDVEACKLLLKYNASLLALNCDKQNPLHLWQSNTAIIALLVSAIRNSEKDSDMVQYRRFKTYYSKDNNGKTPLTDLRPQSKAFKMALSPFPGIKRLYAIDKLLQSGWKIYAAAQGLMSNTLQNAFYEQARLDKLNFKSKNVSSSNFIDSKLRGLKFKGADLSFSYFTEANLDETIFTKSKATLCRFDFCNASYCSFNDAAMSRASFASSNHNYNTFDNATIPNGKWKEALFNGCTFNGADLSTPVSSESNIFNKCNLTNARFVGWSMSGSMLQSCDVSGTDFRNTFWEDTSLSECYTGENSVRTLHFGNSQMVRTKFEGANGKKAKLKDVCFNHTSMDDCSFQNVHLANTSFEDSILNKLRFADISLLDSNILRCDISSAEFVNATLTRVNFCNSSLNKTVFKNCKFKDVNFNLAKFFKVEFINCEWIAPLPQHHGFEKAKSYILGELDRVLANIQTLGSGSRRNIGGNLEANAIALLTNNQRLNAFQKLDTIKECLAHSIFINMPRKEFGYYLYQLRQEALEEGLLPFDETQALVKQFIEFNKPMPSHRFFSGSSSEAKSPGVGDEDSNLRKIVEGICSCSSFSKAQKVSLLMDLLRLKSIHAQKDIMEFLTIQLDTLYPLEVRCADNFYAAGSRLVCVNTVWDAKKLFQSLADNTPLGDVFCRIYDTTNGCIFDLVRDDLLVVFSPTEHVGPHIKQAEKAFPGIRVIENNRMDGALNYEHAVFRRSSLLEVGC